MVDDELVEMSEHPNAVKVTPSHDFDDFECGRRHHLPGRVILTSDGHMNDRCGRFAGMTRFAARQRVVEELRAKGLYPCRHCLMPRLLGEREHAMRIPCCSRTGDVLEPTLLSQWFFRTADVSATVLNHLTAHPPVPPTALQNLATYLHHPKDWCLSRQLWWGHRIPAFHVVSSVPAGSPTSVPAVSAQHCVTKEGVWVIARTKEEARDYACEKLGYHNGTFKLEQDEDVLDTWFSSGLLPLLAPPAPKVPPISVMETGSDILFFWVCRMAWLSEALTHSFPFEDISLHSMVLDPNGKKMSKSRGNVLDPLDIIHGQTLQHLIDTVQSRKELSKKEKEVSIASFKKLYPKGIRAYGNDVMRLTLIKCVFRCEMTPSEANKTAGIKINPIKLEYGRYVSNKLWNLFRFFANYEQDMKKVIPAMDPKSAQLSAVEQYIVSKSESVARSIEEDMKKLDVESACQSSVNYLLNSVCDL